MFDVGIPRVMNRPKEAERMGKIVSLEVLPALDARAEADYASACLACSDSFDVALLREGVRSGGLKASGVYEREVSSDVGERVGTFFWTVITDESGEKTLIVIGLTLSGDDVSYYSRALDAIDDLSAAEGCRWVKFGSGRPGIVRALLERGYTPVFVDFCAEQTKKGE